MAFTNTTTHGVELWLIELESATAQRISEPVINANMGDVINWLYDDSAILTTVLPEDRPELIASEHTVPAGPTISDNDGKKAQNRTYQDLLRNKNDEFNFQVLATSEIWKYDLDGTSQKWMGAAMYDEISLSPDGRFVMVTTINRPFSYIVPYYRFPSTVDVYSIDGQLIANFHKTPLQEERPKGFMSTQQGPRRIAWRADRPHTLYWAEALDGGDPAVEVEYRDVVTNRMFHSMNRRGS